MFDAKCLDLRNRKRRHNAAFFPGQESQKLMMNSPRTTYTVTVFVWLSYGDPYGMIEGILSLALLAATVPHRISEIVYAVKNCKILIGHGTNANGTAVQSHLRLTRTGIEPMFAP